MPQEICWCPHTTWLGESSYTHSLWYTVGACSYPWSSFHKLFARTVPSSLYSYQALMHSELVYNSFGVSGRSWQFFKVERGMARHVLPSKEQGADINFCDSCVNVSTVCKLSFCQQIQSFKVHAPLSSWADCHGNGSHSTKFYPNYRVLWEVKVWVLKSETFVGCNTRV